MRLLLPFLLLPFCLFQIAFAAGEVKQRTISDFLLQAAAKAEKEGRKSNSLINESSPYLLQHAYNPVDWYAWGDAAFEKARKENKPIFLSIGYSTCHWCHVMAHESFENKAIAEILNRYFVCIKVDREQRPDIDSVYMSATQLINGSGGWPMSVFLDNKLRPFHAATYYPPFSSEGRTGLKEILLKIQDLWVNQPDLIKQVATTVTARITAFADDTAESAVLDSNINDLALQHITESYDEESGGFSAAPKFPSPGIFAFLNNLAFNEAIGKAIKGKEREKKTAARKMMKTTLDGMASGGIYDQIAGGFHRYSVDGDWQVPHFEKMLYSQALMVMAYSDFYRVDAQKRYKQVVFETLNFVKQEMQSPDGGFYSALDADSERPEEPGEHAEGAYYLWREAELKRLLSAEEFSFVKKYFNVKENGNIISDPQDEFTNLNIFYIDEAFRDKLLTKQESGWLRSANKKLNINRRLRPRPHLDDKIITAWNGMMLSAFARASLVFDHPGFLEEATQTLGFIERHLYDKKNGKLYRQYRQQINASSAAVSEMAEATLSDYVWLIYGLLDVYKASNDDRWLDWALELQKKQDELFLDGNTGAYFESIAGDTSVLFRSKSIYDGALPSDNTIALSNVRVFSGLMGKASERKSLASQADKLVNSFAKAINENPSAAAMLLAIEVELLKAEPVESKQ